MTNFPPVTVIIPSYNHARYISTAIDSVLTQTYNNIDLIVVDDGSTDESHAVLREYDQTPNMTTIINTENRGQSAAINQYSPRKIHSILAVGRLVPCRSDFAYD